MGLERVAEGRIDLVLLDLLLPDSRGLATFNKVQKQAPDVPVIVLSDVDGESLAVDAVRKGAQDYLAKNRLDVHLLVRVMLYAIERKQVEEEKVKTQKQLIQIQKMEVMGVLAGGIAHDFNNLLTTIIGYADMALMEIDDADSVYTKLEEIRTVAGRAAELTGQLLFFSRKKPVQFTLMNLNRAIEDLLKMVHRLIREDIKIETDLEPDLWTIRADSGTLRQVILNLVVNARDAMPEGGSVTIKTTNVRLNRSQCRHMPKAFPGRFACLSVSDTGVGMDKETAQHVFDPLFSTKTIGRGAGLCLSVVYDIVEKHGGWIRVTSQPGVGSTFEVYLAAASQSERLEEKAKEPFVQQELKGEGKRILVVEDEEKVREFTACGLNRSGYVVYAAADAKEAADVFKREKGNFNLVLSDVVLPDKSGLELVDEFIACNPNLRVLLSSGYTDHKSRWPIIQERGYRFLEKPYALNDLLRVVQEVAA